MEGLIPFLLHAVKKHQTFDHHHSARLGRCLSDGSRQGMRYQLLQSSRGGDSLEGSSHRRTISDMYQPPPSSSPREPVGVLGQEEGHGSSEFILLRFVEIPDDNSSLVEAQLVPNIMRIDGTSTRNPHSASHDSSYLKSAIPGSGATRKAVERPNSDVHHCVECE
ncbi:hypothetical protein AKJ16_DCAP14324 [Drosera capensis]